MSIAAASICQKIAGFEVLSEILQEAGQRIA